MHITTRNNDIKNEFISFADTLANTLINSSFKINMDWDLKVDRKISVEF